jgi:hypothetical protein
MTSYLIICFFSYTVFEKFINYDNENIIRLLIIDDEN